MQTHTSRTSMQMHQIHTSLHDVDAPLAEVEGEPLLHPAALVHHHRRHGQLQILCDKASILLLLLFNYYYFFYFFGGLNFAKLYDAEFP